MERVKIKVKINSRR